MTSPVISFEQYKIESDSTTKCRVMKSPYMNRPVKRMLVMVQGPTGCCKFRFPEYMVRELKQRLITVACSHDMTAPDLAGRYRLDTRGTRWLDGPRTTATRFGAICYLVQILDLPKSQQYVRVRYQHIIRIREHWTDEMNVRLVAIEASYSMCMGASRRTLPSRTSGREKLALANGKPCDIGVDDPRLLIEDMRKAVQKLGHVGIYTCGIHPDTSVTSGKNEIVMDIFGNQFTTIDKIERLPENLSKLFESLTG